MSKASQPWWIQVADAGVYSARRRGRLVCQAPYPNGGTGSAGAYGAGDVPSCVLTPGTLGTSRVFSWPWLPAYTKSKRYIHLFTLIYILIIAEPSWWTDPAARASSDARALRVQREVHGRSEVFRVLAALRCPITLLHFVNMNDLLAALRCPITLLQFVNMNDPGACPVVAANEVIYGPTCLTT